MIGISVSLYDKFEDLGVLVDVIRHNWDGEYYISVCSNHPEADAKVADIEADIDHFERGAQIEYDPSVSNARNSSNLYYRIYNTIRTAAREAIAVDDIDYVMHLHTDAWPLSEASLQSVIDDMEERDASVAFSDKTHAFLDSYPPGSFDDQFLLFDAADARDVDLFERETLDFPPTLIHQILPIICLAKFGWENIHHYDNASKRQHWDGTPSEEIRNIFRPMFYDQSFDYLHVASEDFPEGLGKSLQAHYLATYDLTDGERIERFLDQYQIPQEVLFERLDEWLAYLDDSLKWYGASVDTFGRDIRIIRTFLESDSLFERLKLLADHKTQGSFANDILSNTFNFVKAVVRDDTDQTSYPIGYNELSDQTLDEYYAAMLEPDDFPEELADSFHENFGR